MRLRKLAFAVAPALMLAAETARGQGPGDTTMTREKSLIISMKSDLRMLVRAQESHFAKHGAYSDSIGELGFRANEGNSVRLTVTERNGWAGEARNSSLRAHCIIWVNLSEDRRPITPKNKRTGGEGDPVCDLDP